MCSPEQFLNLIIPLYMKLDVKRECCECPKGAGNGLVAGSAGRRLKLVQLGITLLGESATLGVAEQVRPFAVV
jgi:hypothetical protein